MPNGREQYRAPRVNQRSSGLHALASQLSCPSPAAISGWPHAHCWRITGRVGLARLVHMVMSNTRAAKPRRRGCSTGGDAATSRVRACVHAVSSATYSLEVACVLQVAVVVGVMEQPLLGLPLHGLEAADCRSSCTPSDTQSPPPLSPGPGTQICEAIGAAAAVTWAVPDCNDDDVDSILDSLTQEVTAAVVFGASSPMSPPAPALAAFDDGATVVLPGDAPAVSAGLFRVGTIPALGAKVRCLGDQIPAL